MNKPKHFNLEEFLVSSTARQKSIENTPSWEIVEHLNELAIFLDDLRQSWGSGINVTSGFRINKLNNAVGGVSNSVHQIGYAADVVPANGKFNEFISFIKKWAINKNFDQIIIEKNRNSQWIHIGLYSNAHTQRKQMFNLSK